MIWLISTITALLEMSQITCADFSVVDLPIFQFRVVNFAQKRTGNYKELTGNIEINMANKEGIEQRWTTLQRNLLCGIIPITEEKIDIKTGIITIGFDIIINNSIE